MKGARGGDRLPPANNGDSSDSRALPVSFPILIPFQVPVSELNQVIGKYVSRAYSARGGPQVKPEGPWKELGLTVRRQQPTAQVVQVEKGGFGDAVRRANSMR